jgi:hypothetical protein
MLQVTGAVASAFVTNMKNPQRSFAIGVDPNLFAAASRSSILSSSWLVALAVTMGVPVSACALLASSGFVCQAAKGAGMLSCAVPAHLSARASRSNADAVFDGFGAGGGATWARISGMLARRRDAQ